MHDGADLIRQNLLRRSTQIPRGIGIRFAHPLTFRLMARPESRLMSRFSLSNEVAFLEWLFIRAAMASTGFREAIYESTSPERNREIEE